jgi:hypothetical protein
VPAHLEVALLLDKMGPPTTLKASQTSEEETYSNCNKLMTKPKSAKIFMQSITQTIILLYYLLYFKKQRVDD